MGDRTSTLRKFVAPEIVFGNGARMMAGKCVRNYGARKVLIVSDPGVIEAGWLDDVINSVASHGIDYSVYSGITPNPRVTEVMHGADFYRQEKCDAIIALGGGSPMDCAKGIGMVVCNDRHILEFEGVDKIGLPVPPLVFIPTTAGSSSDVSQLAIISNRDDLVKITIASNAIIPDVALIDPETTMTMDSMITAYTGIDALVHAIEAFVSTGSSPMTDIHALKAIELLRDNLPLAAREPLNLSVREKIMLGSMEAGLAFSNAILGAVHAMSHSLGGFLDLPHGECNAMLLDRVIEFNYDFAQERYRKIAETLGVNTGGMVTGDVKKALIASVVNLKKQVGLTSRLKQVGVTSADIPVLSRKAVNDACMLTNPRKVSKRDVEVIYEEAL